MAAEQRPEFRRLDRKPTLPDEPNQAVEGYGAIIGRRIDTGVGEELQDLGMELARVSKREWREPFGPTEPWEALCDVSREKANVAVRVVTGEPYETLFGEGIPRRYRDHLTHGATEDTGQQMDCISWLRGFGRERRTEGTSCLSATTDRTLEPEHKRLAKLRWDRHSPRDDAHGL
ncbi:MAG: hypothetical protein HY002_05420 [Candidatus Rokubacteria bacterium]|nr:hypothetical protein [Candidatus Rokubacteria bacterium]